MDIFNKLLHSFKHQTNSPSPNADNEIADLSNITVTPNIVAHTPFQMKQIHLFKLPIDYLDSSNTFKLSPVVSTDLELIGQPDRIGMYEYIFQPTHSFGKLLVQNWSKIYTTNTDFLNDTQLIVQNMGTYNSSLQRVVPVNCERMFEIWDSLKQDASFTERYGYLEWDMLKQFNRSPQFLQVLSVMNIMSPAISLMLPFIFILVPFILLKIQGIPISFNSYIEILVK